MKITGTKQSLSAILAPYLAAMACWFLVQTLVLHHTGIAWNLSLADSAVSSAVLAFYGYVIICIFSFYQPGKNNYIYRLLFAFAFALLNCYTFRLVLGWIIPAQPEYLNFAELSIPVRFAFSLLVFSFITAFYWLWNNLNEQREREDRRTAIEQRAKEAELVTLKQQLQPHFLFNSLNSISALALSKPQDARRMIQQLSDFLRGTLKKDDQKQVLLNDELQHLNLYLEIEKVRFGHRLGIEAAFAENSLACGIPPLLIQPIVENAIKFGLYDTIGQTVISISTSIVNSTLVVCVKNPFDADTQKNNSGTGFGLSSIQRRLFLLYARNDLLTTEKKENQFIATLKIPQQNQQ